MILVALSLLCLLVQTDAHGRLLHPPGRSTLWRFGFNTPHNSNDHQLSCGGFGVQFYRNQGKCGVCGDPYHAQVPRDNEAGGTYGLGVIGQTFKQGDVMPVTIEITVNHGGWSEFKLCPVNDRNKRATEECFDQFRLKTVDGQDKVPVAPGLGPQTYQLQLPSGLTCSQCVLRWRWNTASNVACEGSKCCRGCGNQEQFYGCADISITPAGQGQLVQSPQTKPPGANNVANNNINNSPGGAISSNVNNAWQPPQSGSSQIGSFPGPVINPGSVPDSFVPIFGPVSSGNVSPPGSGSQPVPSNNQVNNPNNNQIPAGFVPIGENTNYQPSCRATDFFKQTFSTADQWCVTNCEQGNCPSNLCSRECTALNLANTNQVCTATPLLRQKRPDADTWCRQACALGFCPESYCEKTCKK